RSKRDWRSDVCSSDLGIKGYAFIGALQTIKEHQYEINRVAGTSAGAILAACIAANYTVEEIEQMLEQVQIENLLDPPFLSKYVRSEERRVGKECRCGR